MTAHITPHVFSGNASSSLVVPSSKSHTIRRLFMAALGGGVSIIENPLDSLDARSCVQACRVLGADISEKSGPDTPDAWIVRGLSAPKSVAAQRIIDVGNSGTTLFLGLAAAALFSQPFTFSGDEQIARRSAAPLLDALAGLGAAIESKGGCIPVSVCGPLKGGKISISCPTSQYLSALLLACPLAPDGTLTEIEVPLLNEKPYIEMTLSYLKKQGLCGENAANKKNGRLEYSPDFSHFCISGGASYKPLNGPVPGDFSSAAFPAAAALLSGGSIVLLGLDPDDSQGDKVFFEYLVQMGCDVRWDGGGKNGRRLSVSRAGPLRGGVFDLNATPDMLPVMAVLGAFAKGTTELVNVAHARIKETDRIAVMAAELKKIGVHCDEKPDALVIHGKNFTPQAAPFPSPPGGLLFDGCGDHRIVMALSCAALGLDPAAGPIAISGAETANVTYPGFLELLGAVF